MKVIIIEGSVEEVERMLRSIRFNVPIVEDKGAHVNILDDDNEAVTLFNDEGVVNILDDDDEEDEETERDEENY